MLIIPAARVSTNLIISTMPGGFDCLHLFWQLVSQVGLVLKGQVLRADLENQVLINIIANFWSVCLNPAPLKSFSTYWRYTNKIIIIIIIFSVKDIVPVLHVPVRQMWSVYKKIEIVQKEISTKYKKILFPPKNCWALE